MIEQVRSLSPYVARPSVLNAHRAALAGHIVWKASICSTLPEHLDRDLIDQLLRAIVPSTRRISRGPRRGTEIRWAVGLGSEDDR